MSKTVDERVVEMQFDNKQFEQNVQTSMGTLEKLKQSLNFNGASKGLENLGTAANNVNVSHLGNAIETVHAKFSALEVVGMTALSNITNSAINAGKRLVDTFAIDPINTGFNEFELKMGSVQTIMASTGESLQTVNQYLNELNEYSDKTIYSFSDMTNNIGKFTNAGVGLEDAVMAIKGISNEAALSGANANEASHAMYNFAQALSAGHVQLIDWKSIENANMATVDFKEQLIEAAVAAGTLEKSSDGMYKVLSTNAQGSTMDAAIDATHNFNDSLSYQWMTTEVLVNTLKNYADETTDIGKKAYSAAQDVKTFSMMVDTLKEAAQSGWAQTWELIIGDFEEGKTLWTSLSEMFGSIIEGSANARNQFLGEALNSNWEKIEQKVSDAGIAVEDFEKAVKQTAREHGIHINKMIEEQGSLAEVMTSGKISGDIVTEAIKKMTGETTESSKEWSNLGEVVAQVVRGDFGTGQKEIDALTKAGYDYNEVQELVNQTYAAMGYSWGTYEEVLDTANGLIGENAEALVQLSDEELKNKGYTDEQIKALRELAEQAEKTGTPLNELINNLDQPGGRSLFIESIMNSFKALGKVMSSIKEAWKGVFGEADAGKLYELIEGFHTLTSGLLENVTAHADEIARAFKGVFSIFDMVASIITGALSNAFNFIQSILDSLDIDILGIAASIGDFFTSLNDGFQESGFSGFFENFGSGISELLNLTSEGSDFITNLLSSIGDAFGEFGGTFASVGSAVSTVVSEIWDVLKTLFTWITEHVSGGDIFAGLAGGGIFMIAKKLSGVFDKVKEGIEGFFDIFKGNKSNSIKENFVDTLSSMHDALDSFSAGIKATSLIAIAIAIGILTSSLEKLSKLKKEDIVQGIAGIGAMMLMLGRELKSLLKTLKTYDTKGLIKTGVGLILIAKAINTLSDAMVKLSGLSWEEIGKGLTGVGGGLIELSAAIRIIGNNRVPLSTSIALIALAESCDKISSSLMLFSEMSWDEIARGLSAMGGALGELTAVVSILSKTSGFKSLFGSAGIVIIVQSLEKMAAGLAAFGQMSWDEIGQGLTGMGGALAEVGAAATAVGKLAGFSSIFGAAAIDVVIAGLSDLAKALKKFGKMSWDEIEQGLAGMGGALAEVGTVTGALGYLSGFSSIFGALSIDLTISQLDELAKALKKFGTMTWDEIEQGLTAMGGALAEVAVVTGGLGYLAGFSSIFGALSIDLTISQLDELAKALKKLGNMTWDQIGQGLTAMGGALAEVGVVTGSLGHLAGFSSIFGALSIDLTISQLDELASALKSISEMSWDEIGRGLAGMGGALGEVGAVSGLEGAIAGFAGLVGGGSLALATSGLNDLATAFGKFGEMSWDEIGQGLAAMGGAMGETALGGLLNTLSGIGADAIATIAEPLGTLADSVKKWVDVEVPDGLGSQIGSLAGGIMRFTFGGLGAGALSQVADPLGILADSVKKWIKVEIPDGLGDQIGSLASGIMSFTFGGFGAGAISAVAEPLGTLAKSTKKWISMQVPDGLGDKIASLASGVSAFNFAGWGGDAIASAATPLGTLADSTKKWTEVEVPDGIGDDISSLASGVSAFNFSGWGGDAIAAVATPLGTLADSAKKWQNISITTETTDSITNLADAVKKFNWGQGGADTISTAAEPLGTMADSVSKWISLSIPADLSTKISDFATAISGFSSGEYAAGVISGLATPLSDLAGSIKKLKGEDISTGISVLTSLSESAAELEEVDFEGISEAISNFAAKMTELSDAEEIATAVDELISSFVNELDSKQDELSEAVNDLMSAAFSNISSGEETDSGAELAESLISGFVDTISQSTDDVSSAAESLMKAFVSVITGSVGDVSSAASDLMSAFIRAVNSGTSLVLAAIQSMITRATSTIRAYYNSFYSAGVYLVQGFANGITDKTYLAEARARAMASAASNAATQELGENSPSKVFYKIGDFAGVGFVNGMTDQTKSAKEAGTRLGESAEAGLNRSVSSISTLLDDEIDTSPTIRPVLDLSNIRAGAGRIGTLINPNRSIMLANGLSASTSNLKSIQNGAGIELISAIERMAAGNSSVGGNTYIVNGVTYDDGSNIAGAVRDLVRAARIERRA